MMMLARAVSLVRSPYINCGRRERRQLILSFSAYGRLAWNFTAEMAANNDDHGLCMIAL